MTLARLRDSQSSRCSRVRARSVRIGLIMVATMAFLIATLHAPVIVRTNLQHDDGLFLALGHHIAAGNWLGDYNQFTLIKGPGYPAFLALNSWVGLPVGFSQALLQLGSIALFFRVFARIARMPNLAALGYVFALLAPSPYLQYVLREAIYPSETLLVLGTLLYWLFGNLRPATQLRWALISGLVTGWMLLTREEGIWLVPGIAIPVLYASWLSSQNGSFIPSVLMPLLVMVLVVVTIQGAFCSFNWLAYGRFSGVETNSSPFKDALRVLQSVNAGRRIPYVPVSRKARYAIYTVSPTFRRLKGYLDPTNGKTPWQFGCSIYPQTCGDIAGGWFMWALRDAVASKGYYTSAERADAFYRALTTEVTDACQDHRLQCSPTFTMMPHISSEQWRNLPASLIEGVRLVTEAQAVQLSSESSTGDASSLEAALSFLGNPPTTPLYEAVADRRFHVAGWYRSRSGGWISGLIEQPGVLVPIPRVPSPDLVLAFNDESASTDRFDFTLTCGRSCDLKFVDAGGRAVSVDLARRAGQQFSIPLGEATLNFDLVSSIPDSKANSAPQYRMTEALRHLFSEAYSRFLPWIAGAALLAMFLVVGRAAFTRRLGVIAVTAIAVWALIASRLFLLGLIDISSFRGMQPRLLAPAYILICLAVVLTFAALHASLCGALHRQRGPL